MSAAMVASIAEIAQRHDPQYEERPSALDELRSRLLTRDDLANLPQPEPLIGDTLDKRTLALLAGYHGTCKSFIALDWACCIATGRAWQGRPVAQGQVLYVASEGAEGLHERVNGWEYAWREKVGSALNILPMPVQLAAEDLRNALISLAVERSYSLVILDTLARCAVGLDENSARDLGLIIEAADQIRRKGITVLFVHHTGKDKVTTRGSSALEAGMDTVYTTEGDTRFLKLTRTKRKEGPVEDLHILTLKRNESGSCHVQGGGQDFELQDRGQRLLSTFLSTFKETGASKAELRNTAGMPNATFSRALNDLVSAGSIRNKGTDQRPFYILGTGALS